MSTVFSKVSNGVSYGTKYSCVAQDDTDGEVIIDFQVNYDLAGIIQILRAGVVVTEDAVITFPEAGQVSIADGSTYAVTAGDIIVLVANRSIASV